MTEYTLRCWSVQRDPFRAPECPSSLCGYRNDGNKHRVVTSPIRTVEGRRVTTESGTVYLLEDPDPKYVKYLEDRGDRIDPENPIRVLKKGT